MTQPTCLADDARKIAEALNEIKAYPRETDDVPKSHKAHYLLTCVQHIARTVLPLAESLPGKIEARELDIRQLLKERDQEHGEKLRYTEFLKYRTLERDAARSAHKQSRKDVQAAESQLAIITKERDDLIEQMALRTDSAMHKDLQIVMQEHNSTIDQLATMTQERDEWQTCAEEKIALLQHEVATHRKRIEASNVFEAMWRSAEKETIDLESQLADRDAEIGRLREALGVTKQFIDDEYSYTTLEDKKLMEVSARPIFSTIEAALSPPIAAKQDDPTEPFSPHQPTSLPST